MYAIITAKLIVVGFCTVLQGNLGTFWIGLFFLLLEEALPQFSKVCCFCPNGGINMSDLFICLWKQ